MELGKEDLICWGRNGEPMLMRAPLEPRVARCAQTHRTAKRRTEVIQHGQGGAPAHKSRAGKRRCRRGVALSRILEGCTWPQRAFARIYCSGM